MPAAWAEHTRTIDHAVDTDRRRRREEPLAGTRPIAPPTLHEALSRRPMFLLPPRDTFAGWQHHRTHRGLLIPAPMISLISDPDAVREVWDDALAAPVWTGPALWLHADLHPANLLTRDGNFCGVIDFGDMCAGDPACDLAACWMLLPDGVIDRFHQSYSSADAATLRRARGWALVKALACLLIGDNGVHGRPGGKATWGPPADAALKRLTATRP